jgi:hypothetical protein
LIYGIIFINLEGFSAKEQETHSNARGAEHFGGSISDWSLRNPIRKASSNFITTRAACNLFITLSVFIYISY